MDEALKLSVSLFSFGFLGVMQIIKSTKGRNPITQEVYKRTPKVERDYNIIFFRDCDKLFHPLSFSSSNFLAHFSLSN
jgi:hypothetical protein